MKVTLLLIACIGSISVGLAQELDPEKEYVSVCVGFYNLENLFDTLDTEHVRDSEFTPDGSKNWNTEKYQQKLENMASVIAAMATGVNPDGPAVLGVCEIENISVLEDLVKMPAIKNRNYKIVHYDSPDKRGIDVALLYQEKYFTLESSRTISLVTEDTGFYTRDQLLVSGILDGEEMHFMVSHWPSRRGGEKRSRPKREAAADLGRSVIDSIQAVNPKAKVVYMGDLNDNPNNSSVKSHLNCESNIHRVSHPKLYNPMANLFQKGIGTAAWRDNWNLFDQIICTPELVTKDADYDTYRFYLAKIYNKDFLIQSEGSYAGYPFRSFVGNNWLGGYSDHFPVYILLIKEKK